MPAVTTGAPERNNKPIYKALKIHITRERQRKKEEQEADAEEERQRKERETQQKQNVMTIEETKEQLQSLENELTQLRQEKHQLFVQLKKVLHEDADRRRVLKETNVAEPMQQVGGYIDQGTIVHPHLYLPVPRNTLYKVSAASSSHTQLTNNPMKRSHSPSPPPPPSIPTYHPGYGYKLPSSLPNYIPAPKSEEAARRSGDSRVVLWNKSPSQFPSTYYGPPTAQYDFGPPPTSQPLSRVQEPGKPVYLTAARAPMPAQTTPYPDDKFYSRQGSHVAVHGGPISLQQPPQSAKTGSITSGYPRAPQPPQGLYQPPPGTYVSVAGANVAGRMLFTQPGPRYLQRDV